jgi:hypothetical protein
MKPPNSIHFLVRNERERAEFLEAGVDLPKGEMTEVGEFIRLDISEDDPRWENFARIVRKRLERLAADVNERAPKNKTSQAEASVSLASQTAEQLLSLQGKCRTDSLVVAFEQAISQKAGSAKQGLSNPEHIVLAVEALEREVNNGGYDQFFTNSSREFAPTIVDSLRRIGCKKAASITERALKALGVSDPTVEAIDTAMAVDDEERTKRFAQCDDEYYKNTEPIAERLFAFIKANKAEIKL